MTLTVPPALVLSLAVILVSAFAFQTVAGRTARGLLAVVPAAAVGFVAGETAARLLVQDWGMVGPIHLVHGLIGAWLAMVVARARWP